MNRPTDHGKLAQALSEHVRTLTQSSRVPKTAGHRSALEYIRSRLVAAGFPVKESRFRGPSLDGINLLTEPFPEDPELPLLIVGAHYDAATGTPGADDNASGVAALLELANHVQNVRKSLHPKARIQLVAYDLEEYGMVGSWQHSLELAERRERLLGMIALEMLGYADHRPNSQRLPAGLEGVYPNVGNFIGICGNQVSRELAEALERGMRTVAGLPVESLLVPGNGEMLPEVRLSDHSSFWDRGYQAVMISDTSFYRNPHYHQPTDTLETLDLDFLAKVTQGICAGVVEIATS
jgi:Zn-dependent M28 family amino/carboxypeptidase